MTDKSLEEVHKVVARHLCDIVSREATVKMLTDLKASGLPINLALECILHSQVAAIASVAGTAFMFKVTTIPELVSKIEASLENASQHIQAYAKESGFDKDSTGRIQVPDKPN